MNAPKLIIASIFIAVVSSIGAAQDDVHGIVRRDHYSNLPYEIVSWTVDGKPMADVSRFTAGPDWWQHIAISAKNTTQKTITHQIFDLFVEPIGKMTIAVDMKLQPDNAPEYGKLNWMPGQTMVFRIQDREAAMWVKHFQTYDIAGIDHIAFQATAFSFDDGTEWTLGQERPIRAGQSSDPTKKLIRLGNWLDNAPVHVKAIETNGLSVTPGEAFAGGGDWLKDVKVTFSNDSSLPITCVRFSLAVLDSHPTAAPFSFWVTFGMERSTLQTCSSTTSVAPGQRQEAAFLPGDYDRMKTRLAVSEDLTSRTTAELWLGEVYFADGRRWIAGQYQRLNPNDPGHWISEPRTTHR